MVTCFLLLWTESVCIRNRNSLQTAIQSEIEFERGLTTATNLNCLYALWVPNFLMKNLMI